MGLFLLGIFMLILSAIMIALVIVVFVGIAVLIVKGSTSAPALVFALLFTMGKSDNLIVSILIFAVSFYAIKRLIQYKKVENAIMVHLAVAASFIATFSVKMAISFLFKRSPAWILLALMIGIMIFMLSPVIARENQNEKKGYPIITRVIASILYGSSVSTLVGSLVLTFDIAASENLTVFCYILSAVSSVLAYILDVKFSENEGFIKNLRESPIVKIFKEKYDMCVHYILTKLVK